MAKNADFYEVVKRLRLVKVPLDAPQKPSIQIDGQSILQTSQTQALSQPSQATHTGDTVSSHDWSEF